MSQSIGSYKKALKYADTDSCAEPWGYIGDAYHQMEEAGRKDSERDKYRRRCFEAYDRSLHYYYDNPMVLNNYAYFISESSWDPRQLDRAFAMAARAVELDGNNATLLDTYAWVLPSWTTAGGSSNDAAGDLFRPQRESGTLPALRGHPGGLGGSSWPKPTGAKRWRRDMTIPGAIEERIRQLKSKP